MSLRERINSIIFHPSFIWVLIIIIPLGVSVQNYAQGDNHFWGSAYTFYNNYVIFKTSFLHLAENKNLFILHLSEHADYYKYSPTFALCMAPFYYLPDLIGLFLWNFLNCLIFYLSLRKFRFFSDKHVLFVMTFVLLELILTTQSSQSNALIAGLIIFSFHKLEESKPGVAAFLIVAGAFIKIFAIVACLLFVLYPNKLKFVLYVAVWTVVLALAPLVLISPHELTEQYHNWFVLLAKDHSESTGMSLYTIIWHLIGTVNKFSVLLGGVFLLVLPLVRFERYKEFSFRAWFLCAILIWIVIFNHKGESPTYVIAMTGCAIWAVLAKRTHTVNIIAFLCWMLTSAIKTDLVPTIIKDQFNLNFINALMPSINFSFGHCQP